ncbi:cell division protein ZapA [Altererythrobacter litoralis]|uniref:Cell division protein ZapA n=1 Tax=Altererythrobacter litoralis TaxID=3113904 RepID=A0ABU7GFU3_9SPHN|nr:cell division protein ZapA [Erythrobacteraceae bacterium 1XM1-14]
MSQVTLRIGGRSYVVACADGQEAHLARLGAMVEEKFRQMEGNLAPQEAQNLLFAAILLADELHDAREAAGGNPAELGERLDQLEKELAAATGSKNEAALELDAVRAERDALANDLANIKSAASGQQPLFAGADMATRLEQLAEQVEKCADTLEGKLSAP